MAGRQLETLRRIAAMAYSTRTALFIDGGNFHACAKALGIEVDYKRLLKEFQEQGVLIRAYYFSHNCGKLGIFVVTSALRLVGIPRLHCRLETGEGVRRFRRQT